MPRSLAALWATVLLPFALAHFVSYLYRTVNAVVYPDLAQELGLAAGSIGLLTSAYFLAFAAAQLPIGVALDRFGPRKLQVPMLLIAAAGALLFARAQSLGELALARGLIGLGVAASLMSAIKACSLWLPPEPLSLGASVLLAVGGMGAMASTTPMQWALGLTDWRGAFMALALGTLLIGALIFVLVPEHGAQKSKTKTPQMAQTRWRDGAIWPAPSASCTGPGLFGGSRRIRCLRTPLIWRCKVCGWDLGCVTWDS